MVREQGLPYYARWMTARADITVRDALARGAYPHLTAVEAARQRRSATVFVFGSGYSLNDLSPREWQHFAAHDVFGFSGFIYQQWIRVDFHLVRGWYEDVAGLTRSDSVEAYARRLRENPHFRDTVLLLQGDAGNLMSNALVGRRLLSAGTRICRYRTARRLDDLPSDRWRDGLVHGPGTLGDVVNAAYLLGWRMIVLVGIDLYDSRYFWGPPDATLDFDAHGEYLEVRPTTDHGVAWNAHHNTTNLGIVPILGACARRFADVGVQLLVYNPRSLLSDVLPVYRLPAVR